MMMAEWRGVASGAGALFVGNVSWCAQKSQASNELDESAPGMMRVVALVPQVIAGY